MGTSITALLAGGLGIGIGWGVARLRHREPVLLHRLVLARWEPDTHVKRVDRPTFVDWSTQPLFDPAHPEGDPS